MTAAGVRRKPGLLQFVDVGCIVWSSERGYRGRDEFTDEQVEPLGGVVVAVTEKYDAEAGAIDRAFLVVDHTRTRPYLRWHTFAESEVNREAIEWPDHTVHTRLWRALAEDIAYSSPGKRRRGPGTPGEVRCAHGIITLQELIFGADGVQYAELDAPAPGKACAPRPSFPPAPASMFVD